MGVCFSFCGEAAPQKKTAPIPETFAMLPAAPFVVTNDKPTNTVVALSYKILETNQTYTGNNGENETLLTTNQDGKTIDRRQRIDFMDKAHNDGQWHGNAMLRVDGTGGKLGKLGDQTAYGSAVWVGHRMNCFLTCAHNVCVVPAGYQAGQKNFTLNGTASVYLGRKSDDVWFIKCTIGQIIPHPKYESYSKNPYDIAILVVESHTLCPNANAANFYGPFQLNDAIGWSNTLAQDAESKNQNMSVKARLVGYPGEEEKRNQLHYHDGHIKKCQKLPSKGVLCWHTMDCTHGNSGSAIRLPDHPENASFQPYGKANPVKAPTFAIHSGHDAHSELLYGEKLNTATVITEDIWKWIKQTVE